MSYELLLRSCAHKKTFAKKEKKGVARDGYRLHYLAHF